jgi:hypothetical protein
LAENVRPKDSFSSVLLEGIKQGLFSFYSLFKVMAPVFIFVSILKKLQVLAYIAGYLTPFMKYFGLPGDAALAIVLGWGINIYAAIAAFASLGLDIKQITILGIMMGMSHTLFMETAVVRQMKARPWIILALRISIGIVLGLLLNLLLPENL